MAKDQLLFKGLALGAMVVGGIAIAQAVNARLRRQKDEQEIAEIAENFSGMRGRRITKGVLGGGTKKMVYTPCTSEQLAQGYVKGYCMKEVSSTN